MIRSGQKIRLTADEKQRLSNMVMEPVAPETIDDHNAWIDHAVENVWNGDTPEEKLMRAVLSDQKIVP
jgi:hypothetical protein